MNRSQKIIQLCESKQASADIEDSQYYLFRVFHISQNRDMGSIKRKGKELKQFMSSALFRVDKIKKTTSPAEDDEQYRKAKKAKANFLARYDGNRKQS